MDKQVKSQNEQRSMYRDGTRDLNYYVYDRGEWVSISAPMVEEAYLTIYINGQEFVTVMATPRQQRELAIGFLFSEGLIDHRDDVIKVDLAPNNVCVDVWLKGEQPLSPYQPILTSGCGRGVTFNDPTSTMPPLESNLRITPARLAQLMQELHNRSDLYRQARGVHAAGLANPAGLVTMAEDVGRHNTFDKLIGHCLLNGTDTHNHILLSTGRISSEMLNKARRMEVPLVASRSSPTSLSAQRAEQWNITLVGYLRPERMKVYSCPERLR